MILVTNFLVDILFKAAFLQNDSDRPWFCSLYVNTKNSLLAQIKCVKYELVRGRKHSDNQNSECGFK
jgi:hypothetical protein